MNEQKEFSDDSRIRAEALISAISNRIEGAINSDLLNKSQKEDFRNLAEGQISDLGFSFNQLKALLGKDNYEPGPEVAAGLENHLRFLEQKSDQMSPPMKTKLEPKKEVEKNTILKTEEKLNPEKPVKSKKTPIIKKEKTKEEIISLTEKTKGIDGHAKAAENLLKAIFGNNVFEREEKEASFINLPEFQEIPPKDKEIRPEEIKSEIKKEDLISVKEEIIGKLQKLQKELEGFYGKSLLELKKNKVVSDEATMAIKKVEKQILSVFSNRWPRLSPESIRGKINSAFQSVRQRIESKIKAEIIENAEKNNQGKPKEEKKNFRRNNPTELQADIGESRKNKSAPEDALEMALKQKEINEIKGRNKKQEDLVARGKKLAEKYKIRSAEELKKLIEE